MTLNVLKTLKFNDVIDIANVQFPFMSVNNDNNNSGEKPFPGYSVSLPLGRIGFDEHLVRLLFAAYNLKIHEKGTFGIRFSILSVQSNGNFP